MTIPLWILAFFAAAAGVLALSNDHVSLSNWIDPVFGSNLYDDHLGTGAVWALAIIDAVIAVVGVFIGLRLWMAKAERPRAGDRLPPALVVHQRALRHRHRPAVRAPGRLQRHGRRPQGHRRGGQRGGHAWSAGSGSLLRRTQTGYVRNYVLGIVLGTVLVLAFMLTRLWWG